MPTDVISTIGVTSSPVTPDYTSLQAWEDASPANLVTDDKRWIGECLDQGEFTGAGQLLLMAGVTSDATRYPILRCATGASFKDKAGVRSAALNYNASNGVAIRSTSGSYIRVIDITTTFARIEGLQIWGDGANSRALVYQANNGVMQVDSCIIKARGQNDQVCDIRAVVVNTVFIATALGTARQIVRLNRPGCKVLGCTIINTGTVQGNGLGQGYNASDSIVQNTAVFGITNFTTASVGWTCSYNATNAASAPGSNNQTSLTTADQFENSANDFRAKASGSLDLNGTPDATNLPDDISGTARHASTPTIGAWEVVESGNRRRRVIICGAAA